MTDVEAATAAARDDLTRLHAALARCWDIDLDRLRKGPPPGAVEEWEITPGHASASHPSLRRPSNRAWHDEHGSAIERPAPWTPPGKSTVERAYIESTRELARAHQTLLTRTDWPADDDTCGHGWTPRRLLAAPADHARVVEPAETTEAIRGLAGGLAWAAHRHRTGRLTDAETAAVHEACDHARAALARIPDGLRDEPRPAPRRCARAGCEGADRRPRVLVATDGRVCATCRKRDQRTRAAFAPLS